MQAITPENVEMIIKRAQRRSFLCNPFFLIINCVYEEQDGDLLVYFNNDDKDLVFPCAKPELMQNKKVWGYQSDIEALKKAGVPVLSQKQWTTEYFYPTQQFIDMAGGKFQKVRQQIKRIQKSFAVELRDQCPVAEAKAFLDAWYAANVDKKEGHSRETFTYEYESALQMVDMLDKVRVRQMYLYLDGTLAGITVFCNLYEDFWVSIIEKTDTSFRDLSKLLTHEKAKLMQPYATCSFGDDGMDAALASHKMELRPDRIEPTYTIQVGSRS